MRGAPQPTAVDGVLDRLRLVQAGGGPAEHDRPVRLTRHDLAVIGKTVLVLPACGAQEQSLLDRVTRPSEPVAFRIARPAHDRSGPGGPLCGKPSGLHSGSWPAVVAQRRRNGLVPKGGLGVPSRRRKLGARLLGRWPPASSSPAEAMAPELPVVYGVTYSVGRLGAGPGNGVDGVVMYDSGAKESYWLAGGQGSTTVMSRARPGNSAPRRHQGH
jgi:hypothetical protein